MTTEILIFMLYNKVIGHEFLKTCEEVLPNISNHPRPFFKGFFYLSQALEQCKANI